MNKYELADKLGRDKVIDLAKREGWEFSEPRNNKLAYDCYLKVKGKLFIAEIKNRDEKYNNYPTLFLQKDKYERLQYWKTKLNAYGVLYINCIGDNIYIFNLDKPETTKQLITQWMNVITVESTKIKAPKEVYVLEKQNAKKYIL